jgi:competence protein ComEA
VQYISGVMNKWLNKYFDLSKREFNGLMVLMGFMMLVIVFPYLYATMFPYMDGDAERLVVQKLIVEDKDSANFMNKKFRGIRGVEKKTELFDFDPNTIGLDGWRRLGFSVKQAQSILKYRSKGGRFYKQEDLKKMYTVSDQMYFKIAPYIKIPSSPFQRGGEQLHSQIGKAKDALKIIELNSADTTQLDEVRGVGPAFARRIVKYRIRLGGFYRKEQLLEVFGLDSAKYEEVKDQLSVDVTMLKKININSAMLEDFKNHPYIKYKQVNALIQYRKQHGNYSNIEDLKKVAILTPETIARLAPYLSF